MKLTTSRYRGCKGLGSNPTAQTKNFLLISVLVTGLSSLTSFFYFDILSRCWGSWPMATVLIRAFKGQCKLFLRTLALKNSSNTPQFNRLCVQPEMTPDKPYKPYNTYSKNKINRDGEPKYYLFYLSNNVVDHFSHNAFTTHRLPTPELSQFQRCGR